METYALAGDSAIQTWGSRRCTGRECRSDKACQCANSAHGPHGQPRSKADFWRFSVKLAAQRKGHAKCHTHKARAHDVLHGAHVGELRVALALDAARVHPEPVARAEAVHLHGTPHTIHRVTSAYHMVSHNLLLSVGVECKAPAQQEMAVKRWR